MIALADNSTVQSTESKQPLLTVQIAEIDPDTTAIRCLDWDRDRFDIEFGLDNGTTYNSFLIQGEQIALVDTSHEKFREQYLETLASLVDPSKIAYIIVSHTEPDHSGLVKDVLQLSPEATVIGSKATIQFLENMVHQPFNRRIVKSGDTLDLGNEHVIDFVSAPNLHWPDTMFTYDRKTQILYTCDAFGMHYCSESPFDDDLAAVEAEFRFYYECLMSPNARSVLAALKRMDELPNIATIATGHGPLLFHNVGLFTERYRSWSQVKTKAETTVALFYVSDYGFSDRLCRTVARGIAKTGVAVEMMDLKEPDPQEIQKLVGRSAGVVIAMPPSSGTASAAAHTAIASILAATSDKQVFGLLESGGGDDDPIEPLQNRFRELGLSAAFPVIRIEDEPTQATYQLCEEAGTDLGQELTRERSVKQAESVDDDVDKALGRLSGGLYIITAKQGSVKGATMVSWVAQASFKPLGFTVAMAKDRAIESMMQPGNRFVLNILEEGNYQDLKKHFLKRFAPGADRFAGIKTQPTEDGTPVLTDALAFLECTVVSRMECSDHWVIYSTAQEGRVSKPEAHTAVRHRKVGHDY